MHIVGRIRFSILFAALICFMTSLSAFGQTQEQAKKLSLELMEAASNVAQSFSNAFNLTRGLDSQDTENIKQILAASEPTNVSLHSFAELLTIYSVMRDQADRSVVRSSMLNSGQSMLPSLEYSLEIINLSLARLKSPAAIGETQKIRDEFQKIQTKLQAFLPKK